MFPNDSFDCFDLDSIRLVAIQNWVSTLQRTSHIDADILDLARGEASRRYQDLECTLTCLPSPSREEVQKVIDIWVTWEALDIQISHQGCVIGTDGMHNFIQDLEQTLEHLSTHASEDMFIL